MRPPLIALIGAVVLTTTACASSEQPDAAPSSAASPAVANEATVAAEVAEESSTTERAPAVGACEDPAVTDAAVLPEPLADLGVPFYPCAHESVAHTDTDPLHFVGEYDTSHGAAIVDDALVIQFETSDWDVIERSLDGDNIIIRAEKPGYSLVVVVGPSRTPPATSAIHYTLSEQ